MKPTLPLWCFFALLMCRPCPSDDLGRLPLKLEKGKDLIFMVSSSAGLEPIAVPGPKSTETPGSPKAKSSEAAKPPEKEGIIALGSSDLQYRIEVTEVTAGGASLLVNLDGPVEGPSSAKPTRESATSSRKKTYRVDVDGNGRIASMAVVAGEGKESSAASASDVDSPESVRGALELILGRGLHERALEVGKVYSRTAVSAGAKPVVEGDGSRGTGATAAVPGVKLDSLTAGLGFRFEGKKKDREREIARFTVLAAHADPDPASAKTGEGTGAEKKSREDRVEGIAKGIATEHERVGEASFRWEDGIADTISLLVPRAASDKARKEGFGGTSAGARPEGVRVTILRIDRDEKPKVE